MSDRKLVIRRLLIFVGIGTAYFIFIKITGLSIPCPVHFLSGQRLKCPGCGITTMFLNIIGGNFKIAFEANPCIFILLPVWTLFIGIRIIFAPKVLADGMPANKLFYCLIVAVLVIFGILRNIFIFFQ